MKKVFGFILCYILCLCVLFATLRIANAEGDRIYMPDAGIDVGIYVKNYYGTDSQYYVDKYDCALAQITWNKTLHICDHNNQGFANLKNVKVGDIIYTVINNVKTEYICVDVGYGLSNVDGKYYGGSDHDWREESGTWDIWHGAYKKDGYVYPLVCTTCTERKGKILVVVFDYYEEEN